MKEGSVANAFLGLRNDSAVRAEQSRGLATCIKINIIHELRDMLVEQQTDLKKITNNGRTLQKNLHFHQAELNKSQDYYCQVSKQQEDVFLFKQSLDCNVEIPFNQLQKLQKQNENLIAQQHDAELKYKYYVGQYNAYLEYYSKKMGKHMNTLQNHQVKRIETARDSIMKILVFEISQVKNLQYDVDKISLRVAEVFPQQDVLHFIQTHKSDKKYYKKAIFQQYTSFTKKSLITCGQKEDKHCQELDWFRNRFENMLKGETVEMVENEALEELGKTILKAWTGEPLSEEEVGQFNVLVQDESIRKAWGVGLKQFRHDGKFILLEQGFDNMVQLATNVLNASLIHKDNESARNIMIMSFTLYKVEQALDEQDRLQENKIYLQSQLISHVLWKDKDYWKSAIFESINQELLDKKGSHCQMNESKNDQCVREKNLIFNQLTSYAYNMFLFKMDICHIKEIMNTNAKNFSLWDLQQKDLQINVDNFGKDPSQMKQINSIYLSVLTLDNGGTNQNKKASNEKTSLDKPMVTKKLIFKNIQNNQEQQEKMRIFE